MNALVSSAGSGGGRKLLLLKQAGKQSLKLQSRASPAAAILGSQAAVTATGAERSMTLLSKKSAEEYKKLNYKTKQEATGRPISPHFTIYAWDAYFISSGVNRATGVLLWVGCGGLGAVEILGGSGTSLELMQTLGAQAFPVAPFAKFAVAFPLVYHYLGGLRHLRWDFFPDLLTTPDAARSATLIFGTTFAVSGALMFV